MTAPPKAAAGLGWVGSAVDAYRAGRPVALLFDYDGTLTPIVRHPSLARLPAATRVRLASLAVLPDVAVGVLSGRALDDVRGLVGLPGLCYAGSGGLELDFPGTRAVYPGADTFRAAAGPLVERLGPVLARYPGAWAERKPVALALHHRELGPVAAVRFRAEVAELLAGFPGVRHRDVSESIEVTPAGGWDKGTAVERVLERLGPDVFPVFAGDAANDAEAMAVVALAGGVAVGVGPDAPPLATHRVPDTAAVAAGLDRLARWLPAARGLTRFASASARPPEHHAMPATLSVPESVSAPVAADATDGPGVLVVDADPGFRAEFAAAFRSAGWRVWAAGDPAEAMRLLASHRSAVRAVVADLQLPGLQAARLLAECQAAYPGVVPCATTADVSRYMAVAFRRLSDVTLLTKPLDFAAASATLRWLVGDDDHPHPPEDRAD